MLPPNVMKLPFSQLITNEIETISKDYILGNLGISMPTLKEHVQFEHHMMVADLAYMCAIRKVLGSKGKRKAMESFEKRSVR